MSDAIDILPVDLRLLPLVQHLRYRVYVSEMGFQMAGADPRSRRLIAPTDGLGESFAVFKQDDLVASCQLTPLSGTEDLGAFEGWHIERLLPDFAGQSVVISKLVTDRQHRSRDVLNPLLQHLFQRILAAGWRYAIILAEDHLKPFYSALGFLPRAEAIRVEPYGEVSVMVFDTKDPRHAAGATLAGWIFKDAFSKP